MLVEYSTSVPLPGTFPDHLEQGRIVKFAPAPVPLPDAADAAFLMLELPPFEFEPSWASMVFVHGVSHDCVSDQFAFANTLIIPRAHCRL